jgi:hypothetical protein
VKNFSDEPVTEVEKALFSKGQKFCPVERDPPIVRMQRELQRFYRILRIKWHFDDQPDTRSELEKNFYQKSNWQPPKACTEIENFISRLQEKFDSWKPPRWIKDNLTKGERKFLKDIRDKEDIVYMWEDKGPSFTKMSREQYISSGEKELENVKFYTPVDNDPSKSIKRKNDEIVQNMFKSGEISEKVAEYLVLGKSNLSNFYHLVKTHKIPQDLANPNEWLIDHGFPLRGIISGRQAPTERLAGFVDHFLQPGMKELPTFLRDTKDTLQTVENFNKSILNGDTNLEGVGVVGLDVENMYNNMTEKGACKNYLEGRILSPDEETNVTTKLIMKALDL